MKPKWLVVILSSAFALFWACNTSSKQGVSFAKDIAPIIHTNCSPCHHKGGAGPFNLITYQDVSDKAKTVAEVTKARYMPPWPADPNYSHFKGEKFLTETQINLIQQWVEEGKQAGDTQSIKYPELQYYSSLGIPDVVLELPEIEIAEEDALIGKWVIDKMTINGYDNTDKYAFSIVPSLNYRSGSSGIISVL